MINRGVKKDRGIEEKMTGGLRKSELTMSWQRYPMVSRVASLSISVEAALVMELTRRAIKSVQAPCGNSMAPMAATH